MMLITKEIDKALRANWRLNQSGNGETVIDPKPPLKLFVPWGAGTWLVTERSEEEPDILFGLCDLGFGTPELGYLSLSEIESVRGPGGLGIERDRWFTASKTLSAYAEEANAKGRIEA